METTATDTTVKEEVIPEPSPLDSFLLQKAGVVAELQGTLNHLAGKEKFNRHDIMKGFEKITKLLIMLDNLSDALINDLQVANNRALSLESNLFRVSQLLTIISTVLQDKKVVSSEEMTTAWTEKVKPETEKKLEEMKTKSESPPTE